MPIEMPKGLPFSVDTWSASSNMKRHHFLTHAHKDHAQGIIAHASYPIYSTLFTKTLLLKYYPELDGSLFVVIEVGQSLKLEDPNGDFTVSAYDANHCPGAVMFLFEGYFGNILHTGDCRLTPECLQSLPDCYIGKHGKEPKCPLDYVFLDCTFGQFHSNMPTRHSAIQQVINCIWKHPEAPKVYLTCEMLGQEEILVHVSQTFGDKIYVDKEINSESLKALELTVPESISQDPSSRFHLFGGFHKLYERAEAKIAEGRANLQEPLIIRPSSQWYAFEDPEKRKKERFDQAVRDVFGVWHVCYSIHSSKDELEWALQLLAPKWVVSTTPNCRAMELNYIKKHCFNNQRAFTESLCRIMDISSVESLNPDISIETESILSSCVEIIQSEPIVMSTRQRKRLSLSPLSKRPMVTLFGRARLGIQDSTFELEEKADDCKEDLSFQKEHVGAMKAELKTKRTCDEFEDKKCASMDVKTGAEVRASVSQIGSSKGYSENLRKVYRSMNVPVPRPLPSLVELMKARKMQKRVSKMRCPLTDELHSSSYL